MGAGHWLTQPLCKSAGLSKPLLARLPGPAEEAAMLGTILLIVLILLLLGALPTWPHSRNWGYYPGGGIGLVLLIIIILLLMGRI
jgi:hypothetical protein